jgi:hypothetical protein
MPEIKINLDPAILEALTGMIGSVVHSLEKRPRVRGTIPGDDPLLADTWVDELGTLAAADCRSVLNLLSFAHQRDSRLEITENEAEAILRGCSAIRLQIQEHLLEHIPADQLERGGIDFTRLAPHQQQAYACFAFLAGLQSHLIEAIDPDSAMEP